MRKLMLISALLLASVSAQAGELLLATDAAPRAYSTNHAEPLPPVARNDNDGKNDQDDSAKPQADERAAQARAAQLRAAKMRMEARRFQEAKARRMAARYGY